MAAPSLSQIRVSACLLSSLAVRLTAAAPASSPARWLCGSDEWLLVQMRAGSWILARVLLRSQSVRRFELPLVRSGYRWWCRFAVAMVAHFGCRSAVATVVHEEASLVHVLVLFRLRVLRFPLLWRCGDAAVTT